MRRITANVYVEDRFSVYPQFRGGNPSFLTTSEGVVMIDTPMLPTDAVKWRDKIAKQGEVNFIINTHHHLDHTGGNYFFPGTVVSHEKVKEVFTLPITRAINSEEGETAKVVTLGVVENYRLRVKELDPKGVPLVEHYELREPTVTFSQRLSLYVGSHTIEVFHSPGHTLGHVSVYIPQERTFFAGDNFTNGVQPSLAQCSPLDWVESLKKIEFMNVDVVVPGHGEVCSKREVREFLSFIQKCIDIVNDAIGRGMSKEEAGSRLSFEELYPPIHSGSWYQRMNVLRLYEMLSR